MNRVEDAFVYSSYPEVVECHFTTGQYDMFIKIYAKNNHHLLEIIWNGLICVWLRYI